MNRRLGLVPPLLFVPVFFLAALSSPRRALAAGDPFRFQIPAGWTDLSPGTTAARRADLPPAVAAAARAADYVRFAADLRRTGDELPTMAAVEQPAAQPVDATTLDGIAAGLVEQARRAHAACRVLARAIVPIDGVPSARLMVEQTRAGRSAREIVYVIPGGDRTAILTYVDDPADLIHDAPVFDTSAAGTTGAALPRPQTTPGSRAAGATLSRILATLFPFGLVAFFVVRARRRRRRAVAT